MNLMPPYLFYPHKQQLIRSHYDQQNEHIIVELFRISIEKIGMLDGRIVRKDSKTDGKVLNIKPGGFRFWGQLVDVRFAQKVDKSRAFFKRLA